MKYKIVAGVLALAVVVAAAAATFSPTQEAQAAPMELEQVSVSRYTGIVYGRVINSAGYYTLAIPDPNTDPAITFHVNPWTGKVYYFANGSAPSGYQPLEVTGDGSVELYQNYYTAQLSVSQGAYSFPVYL